MKLKVLYTGVLSALILGMVVAGAAGQEKTQEQKEKEARLQQAIEQQKKAMQEQAKIMEQQAGEIQKAVVQEQGRPEGVRPDDPSRRSRTNVFIGREGADAGAFYIGPGGDFGGFSYFRGSGTSFEFSKGLNEATITRQLPFEVDSDAKNVVMSISGDCKTGEIKVKILSPDGKTYAEVLIDASGNLNWRKSFTVSGEENKDKIGEWTFKVETTKATGYFRISVQTF